MTTLVKASSSSTFPSQDSFLPLLSIKQHAEHPALQGFSEGHIKKLCANQGIPKAQYEKLIHLFLYVFGDSDKSMIFILSEMQDPLLKQQFRARVCRHLAYINGLAQNKSLAEMIKTQAINSWFQGLSSLDMNQPPMNRLTNEVLQTYTFISDPREALFWNNATYQHIPTSLNQLRTNQRNELYQLTQNPSITLNLEKQMQMSSLLCKDVALYLEGRPYSWIDALQDWSTLCKKNKETREAIAKVLPIMSVFQKKERFSAGLPRTLTDRVTSFIKSEACSFQNFIGLMTIFTIERSLKFSAHSWQLFNPRIWIKKFAQSEGFRSDFSFYNQHREVLINHPPREEDYKPSDYPAFVSLRLFFCMEVEMDLISSNSLFEEKKEKKIPCIDKSLSEPSSPYLEERGYLIKTIFQRNAALDDSIKPYFLSTCKQTLRQDVPQICPLVLKKMGSLKERIPIPPECEFFFFVKIYKEERRFVKVEPAINFLSKYVPKAELYKTLFGLISLEDPTEMVAFLQDLAGSPFVRLSKNKIMILIAQVDLFPPNLLSRLFSNLTRILNPKNFADLKGGFFSLLVEPAYYLTQQGNESFLTEFLFKFDYYKKNLIEERLFFKVYRRFLEGKINAKHLDYLCKYQELAHKTLSTTTQLEILNTQLPNVPDKEPAKELLEFYSEYLNSLSYPQLNDVEKAVLWLKWLNARSPEEILVHLYSIKALIAQLLKYLSLLPGREDLYLLFEIIPNCTKNVRALETLFSLREQIMEAGRECTFCPDLIREWECSLDKLSSSEMDSIFSPNTHEETGLSRVSTRLRNYCYQATFLSPQILTDCLHIEEVNQNTIKYSDPLFNHGGQLKKLLPFTFVAVNWELHTSHSPLTLSLFFLNTQTKTGRWLFFPIPLKIGNFKENFFFCHLRELAKVFLAEGTGQKRIEKNSDITAEEVLSSYPEASEHILQLQQIGRLDSALQFLVHLKTRVRNAWWELLSLRLPIQTETLLPSEAAQGRISSTEEFMGNEREKKDHKQGPSSAKRQTKQSPCLTLLRDEENETSSFSTSEISEEVVTRAQKAIQAKEKHVFLTNAKLSIREEVEVKLFISSNTILDYPNVCEVSLYFMISTDRERLHLSPIHYPLSFIEDKAALSFLLSAHFLGLKTQFYRLELHKSRE